MSSAQSQLLDEISAPPEAEKVLDEQSLKAELDRRLEEVRNGARPSLTVEQAKEFLAARRTRRAR